MPLSSEAEGLETLEQKESSKGVKCRTKIAKELSAEVSLCFAFGSCD